MAQPTRRESPQPLAIFRPILASSISSLAMPDCSRPVRRRIRSTIPIIRSKRPSATGWLIPKTSSNITRKPARTSKSYSAGWRRSRRLCLWSAANCGAREKTILRRGSMPFWPSAKGRRLSSGRLLRDALFVLGLTSTVTLAQTTPHQVPKNATTRRANEFTLAALRPGRDKLERAMQLYHTIDPKSSTKDSQTVWVDACTKHTLIVDFDADKRIQVIRTGVAPSPAACRAVSANLWRTGHGLGVGDSAVKLVQLYGPPDSKSPSTR